MRHFFLINARIGDMRHDMRQISKDMRQNAVFVQSII